MMAENPAVDRSLKDLLNGLQKSQKTDIKAYAGGYLNETKLYKPPKPIDYKTWGSAKKPIPVMFPKSVIPQNKNKHKEEKMKSTLKNFTFGVPNALSRENSARKGTRGPVPLENERLVSNISSQGSYSKLDDGVLVESMGGGETMIVNSHYPRPPPKGLSEEDRIDTSRATGTVTAASRANLRDSNQVVSHHKFVPSHLQAITKKDQYKKMVNFEEAVLRKQDTLETNVMSGVRAAEHLEDRLQKDLDKLEFQGYGPNFHRLQVYSDTFEDLIDDSPTFKYILGTIKKEYDDYISSLLDQQPSRHRLLYEQVEQLSARGSGNTNTLADEQRNLSGLETEAKHLLSENERLRKELEEEQLLAEQNQDQEEEAPKDVGLREPVLELTDEVEEAHATILEKLDEIKQLREKLRREYVPSTVVTNLEQCIKETEIESQRIQSQKDFFDQNIKELEKDLSHAIDTADTTEKDAKRVWRKINASNFGGSETDADDTDKWEWYIS